MSYSKHDYQVGGTIYASDFNEMDDQIAENEKLSSNAFPTPTVSADLISITDGADDIPVKAGKFYINPVQAGSGDPAPDNVRAIYGFTKQDIYRTGKNLWGGQAIINGVQKALRGSTVVVDRENKTMNFGAAAPVNEYHPSFTDFKFKENTQYTILLTYTKATTGGANIRIYYTDGTYHTVPSITEADAKQTDLFVSVADKTLAGIRKYNSGGTTRIFYDETGIFEGVHTADEFEAFTGEIIPVTFPTEAGTVYSGWVEVADDGTAKLTVNGGYIASYAGESITEPWISSKDVYAEGTSPSTGAQVVYQLSTPVEYDLDPVTLKTVLGINNIYADTGATDLTYRADTKLYIDNAIASLQALVLENNG